MTPRQPDIVLEIGLVFTSCHCGGRVRLYRDEDGELCIEHKSNLLTCVHRNAIVLGLQQSICADASHRN